MNVSNQPQEVDNLLSEIQLMRGLSHPHIVEYLGASVDTEKGVLYIFQEWVPGGSVQQLLQQFGPFTIGVVKEYTRQILLGLEYLHANGIVHRDIKGGNILVDANRTVKLADFGASTKLTAFNKTQDTTTIKGTPYFMAPEVLASSRYGRKGDVWAVGCTMIQMLTGEPPWKDRNLKGLVQLHLLLTSWDQGPPPCNVRLTPDARECLELIFKKVDTERPTAQELLSCRFMQQEDDLDESNNSASLMMSGTHDPLEDSGVMRGLKLEMAKVVSRSVAGVGFKSLVGGGGGSGVAGNSGSTGATDDTIDKIDRQIAARKSTSAIGVNNKQPIPAGMAAGIAGGGGLGGGGGGGGGGGPSNNPFASAAVRKVPAAQVPARRPSASSTAAADEEEEERVRAGGANGAGSGAGAGAGYHHNNGNHHNHPHQVADPDGYNEDGDNELNIIPSSASAASAGSPVKLAQWAAELPPGNFSESPARTSQSIAGTPVGRPVPQLGSNRGAGPSAVAATGTGTGTGAGSVDLVGGSPKPKNPFERGVNAVTGVSAGAGRRPSSGVSDSEDLTPRMNYGGAPVQHHGHGGGGGAGTGAVGGGGYYDMAGADPAAVRESLVNLKKRNPGSAGSQRSSRGSSANSNQGGGAGAGGGAGGSGGVYRNTSAGSRGAATGGSQVQHTQYRGGGHADISSNRDSEDLTPYPAGDLLSDAEEEGRRIAASYDDNDDDDEDEYLYQQHPPTGKTAHNNVYQEDRYAAEGYDNEYSRYQQEQQQQRERMAKEHGTRFQDFTKQDSLASIEEDAVALANFHRESSNESYYSERVSRSNNSNNKNSGAGGGSSSSYVSQSHSRVGGISAAANTNQPHQFEVQQGGPAAGAGGAGNMYIRPRTQANTSRSSMNGGAGTSGMKKSSSDMLRPDAYGLGAAASSRAGGAMGGNAPRAVTHHSSSSNAGAGIGGGAGGGGVVERRLKANTYEKKSVSARVRRTSPMRGAEINGTVGRPNTSKASLAGRDTRYAAEDDDVQYGDAEPDDAGGPAWLCLKCGAENRNGDVGCYSCATSRGSDGRRGVGAPIPYFS
jgi:serine/threonine protein kinase